MSAEPNKVIYSMIGVSKYYDKKPVLKNIYLSYFYGAKIGVLGLNGSGKSSLLRILAGKDKEFNGETVLSPGHTVGILEQEPELDDKKTVRQVVEEGVQETADALKEYNAINEKFSEPMSDDEMTKLIERQGKVQEKLDALDAWELDSRLEMAMDALRCPPATHLLISFPEVKGGVWPFAGFYFRSLISCFLTSRQTISMPRQWHGLSIICRAIPAPSSQ